MQIALTKKLSDALKLKLSAMDETVNPLFSWTANWTKVWDNRRTEDMIVLVNNAARFTVAIYQVKRKDLKNPEKMMKTAISNTLLFLNFNPEIVKEYMRLAGEAELTQNKSRQTAAWVTKAGLDCSFYVAREYNGLSKIFNDTAGFSANYRYVNYSGNREDGFVPYRAMMNALTELTGMQAYKYRAFELLVTLDLKVYKAVRRIIVPASIELTRFHEVLQSVFDWNNCHLYDFTVFDGSNRLPVCRFVLFEEDLEYDEHAVLMKGHTLAEILPEYRNIIYTYDMGDNWQHEIQLVRVIEEHDRESPYLLEASGQTPPEDVGGTTGFIEFRKIMLNPNNKAYKAMQEWSCYWNPELSDWKKRPEVIHF